MMYDFAGWSVFQLERFKQKKLEAIELISGNTQGTMDEKIEGAEQISALRAEVLQLEKEIAYKEKLDRRA